MKHLPEKMRIKKRVHHSTEEFENDNFDEVNDG